MNLRAEAVQLVHRMADGSMSSTAYDTSWFLRLKNGDDLMFPSTLHWLKEHQHPDGSWGATFETFHDRLISTLAVINSLASLGDEQHSPMLQRGLRYIQNSAHKLFNDDFETIGFELLFPMLLDEALKLGLNINYDVFKPVFDVRQAKLQLFPLDWVYRSGSPAAHNLEFLGPGVDIYKAQSLLDTSGSVANSPSASAYLAQFIDNPSLSKYLSSVIGTSHDGGACNVKPFEMFEISWVYYNLLVAGIRVPRMEHGIRHLYDSWKSMGVGISSVGLMPDADDSAIALKVLAMNNKHLPLDFLDAYRSTKGYLCFPFERNPSVSTNIHIIDALADIKSEQANLARSHARDFLYHTRVDQCYWKDKWHASPYYATCHAILALRGVDQQMVGDALDWVYETQHNDGSWGLFTGTVEETGYCVQAILLADPTATQQHHVTLRRAIEFLRTHRNQTDYPELWIGKGLYAPMNVIESCAISALALYERAVGRCAEGSRVT